MADKAKIFERLHRDRSYLESLGYEVLGVFLQGSQNYGLDYEGSDIDTKAIVIPYLEDIILNNKPVSTTIVLDTNEHIDVKDIRIMFETFKKQNVNFLEILFTEYYVITERYYDLFKELLDHREEIAHYNTHVAVNCMYGMMMEKYKAMEHPYPTIKDKIDKYGYDPKQLHHIIRMHEFLIKYMKGIDFEACMFPNDPKYLIKVKADALLSLAKAREVAPELCNEAKKLKDEYIATHPLEVNKEAEALLDYTLYQCIKKHVKLEILSEEYYGL